MANVLTKETCERVLRAIADRVNRKLSARTLAMYYDILHRELSEEEFVAAARIVYRKTEFFPAPAEFTVALYPPETLALEAIAAARAAIVTGLNPSNPGGGCITRYDPALVPEYLRPAVEAGISAAGGKGPDALLRLTEGDGPSTHAFTAAATKSVAVAIATGRLIRPPALPQLAAGSPA